MHVPPLAHALIRDEMFFAEFAQLTLREPIHLVVVGVPNIQQG